jgi:hypothetical protein
VSNEDVRKLAELGDWLGQLLARQEPELRGEAFRLVMERAAGEVRGYDRAFEAMVRELFGTPVLVVVRPIPLPSRN